jgi:hypothetical protein
MTAALAILASTAILLCACSLGAEFPAFPAVHDMPAPRAEAPMNPEQVKQATDVLITERTQLNTGAQTPDTPPPQASAAGSAAAPVKKMKKPAPAPAQAVTTGSTQTAGADGKP